jgi:hypothetical protein
VSKENQYTQNLERTNCTMKQTVNQKKQSADKDSNEENMPRKRGPSRNAHPLPNSQKYATNKQLGMNSIDVLQETSINNASSSKSQATVTGRATHSSTRMAELTEDTSGSKHPLIANTSKKGAPKKSSASKKEPPTTLCQQRLQRQNPSKPTKYADLESDMDTEEEVLSMDAINARAANMKAGASDAEASAANADSESEMDEDVGEANAEVVAVEPDANTSKKGALKKSSASKKEPPMTLHWQRLQRQNPSKPTM